MKMVRRLTGITMWIGVGVILFWILFPFLWIGVTSLKSPQEITSSPFRWIPSPLFFTNYKEVFVRQPFLVYLSNSFLVASLSTFLALMVGSFAAYAAARLQFPGKEHLMMVMICIYMFPCISIVSPLFLIMKKIHLLNTYPALIIPYTTFSLPLVIFVLSNFFKMIPREMEEAARVDGCTHLSAFFRVVLPVSLPGLFTCAILVFIGAWNEFLFALTFTSSVGMRTVPVGISMYPGQFAMPWGTIFAASMLVTLPLVIMTLLFQRKIISGLTAGAVKG